MRKQCVPGSFPLPRKEPGYEATDTQEESVDEIMEGVFGENWNDEEKRVGMKNTALTVIQTEWHIKCRLVHPHHIP